RAYRLARDPASRFADQPADHRCDVAGHPEASPWTVVRRRLDGLGSFGGPVERLVDRCRGDRVDGDAPGAELLPVHQYQPPHGPLGTGVQAVGAGHDGGQGGGEDDVAAVVAQVPGGGAQSVEGATGVQVDHVVEVVIGQVGERLLEDRAGRVDHDVQAAV